MANGRAQLHSLPVSAAAACAWCRRGRHSSLPSEVSSPPTAAGRVAAPAGDQGVLLPAGKRAIRAAPLPLHPSIAAPAAASLLGRAVHFFSVLCTGADQGAHQGPQGLPGLLYAGAGHDVRRRRGGQGAGAAACCARAAVGVPRLLSNSAACCNPRAGCCASWTLQTCSSRCGYNGSFK